MSTRHCRCVGGTTIFNSPPYSLTHTGANDSQALNNDIPTAMDTTGTAVDSQDHIHMQYKPPTPTPAIIPESDDEGNTEMPEANNNQASIAIMPVPVIVNPIRQVIMQPPRPQPQAQAQASTARPTLATSTATPPTTQLQPQPLASFETDSTLALVSASSWMKQVEG